MNQASARLSAAPREICGLTPCRNEGRDLHLSDFAAGSRSWLKRVMLQDASPGTRSRSGAVGYSWSSKVERRREAATPAARSGGGFATASWRAPAPGQRGAQE